jgi:L-threonylcarbamoyladenylate synthase
MITGFYPVRLSSILCLFMFCHRSIISFKTLPRFHKVSSSSLSNYMKAHYIDIGSDQSATGIQQAAEIIKNGGLVAFPTETVYGLGANALNDDAVKSVFQAKGRPASDPLIVHIVNISDIDNLFDFQAGSQARNICLKLVNAFWPGPLTLVHRAKAIIPPSVTANSGFVGLRFPRHPVARALIQASGLPIAAPSANRFGHVSPTRGEHVMADLYDQEVAILRDPDNDAISSCEIGIESTVCMISPRGDSVTILRCGAVTSKEIDAVLKQQGIVCQVSVDNEKALSKSSGKSHHPTETKVNTSQGEENEVTEEGAVAPGQMIRHYSPDIPTYLISSSSLEQVASSSSSPITASIQSPSSSSTHSIQISLSDTLVIDYAGSLAVLKPLVRSYVDLASDGDIEAAYRGIFHELRHAEKNHIDDPSIKCLLLPDLKIVSQSNEKVRALWERIHRAASGESII